MLLIGTNSSGKAVTLANHLQSVGWTPQLLGGFPSTQEDAKGGSDPDRHSVNFGMGSEIVNFISQESASLVEDPVSTYVFLPGNIEPLNPRLVDQIHLGRMAQELLYGPVMMYRYLFDLNLLHSDGCKVLFVQPCARLQVDSIAWHMAVEAYPIALRCLSKEFAPLRQNDSFSVVSWDAEHDPLGDELCKQVERYVASTESYAFEWSI